MNNKMGFKIPEHLTTPNVGKNVEQQELSAIASGNEK